MFCYDIRMHFGSIQLWFIIILLSNCTAQKQAILSHLFNACRCIFHLPAFRPLFSKPFLSKSLSKCLLNIVIVSASTTFSGNWFHTIIIHCARNLPLRSQCIIESFMVCWRGRKLTIQSLDEAPIKWLFVFLQWYRAVWLFECSYPDTWRVFHPIPDLYLASGDEVLDKTKLWTKLPQSISLGPVVAATVFVV